MKIALFGASGNIGQRILDEALHRGHVVTAIVRHPGRIPPADRLSVVRADITDVAPMALVIAGHDAVVNATSAQARAGFVRTAQALIEGMKLAKVRRLITVGGAGSLEVSPGQQLVDVPYFPPQWKESALGHRDALAVYQAEKDLEWTYFSPAAFIKGGRRTGHFRLGTHQLMWDASGKSSISMEDYAVALLDELEHPKFIRQRFTAAY